MNNRLFVTGFQRGGTTLVRRLLHTHPQVECMIHEGRILNKSKNIEDVYRVAQNYRKWEGDIDGVWGEKVPWNSGSGEEITSYINRWVKFFKEDARIVNIIRHPVDTGLSNQKKGWMGTAVTVNRWKTSMPRVIKRVKEYNHSGLNIVYENLLLNPKIVLERLFYHCDLINSEEVVNKVAEAGKEELRWFDKIEPSRAFAHRFNSSYQPNYSIEEYLDFVKEFWIGDINEYFNA